MFSICIPVYNYEVGELVKNLQAQAVKTKLPFEIVLMDDASSDEYRKSNAAIDLPGVRYIQLTENGGRCKIRNQLAREAKYPYLIFMDCDSLVPSEDYLCNYIACMEPDVVCYGGCIYQENPPEDSRFLRWKYGVNRESVPAEQRRKEPNFSFKTGNFLIAQSVFEKVRFDERLEGYGHEDTLFGIQLLGEGIIIRHIDNPLVHIGLEDAETFLQKTENGTCNLKKVDELLSTDYPEYAGHSRLIRIKKTLDKWKLTTVTAFILSFFQPLIKRNLLGKHPSLRCFDLYKLGILCGMKQIRMKPALLVLIAYTLLLSYWMLLGFGRVTKPEYSYNLVPFSSIERYLQGGSISLWERLVNLVGNIVVFIPFGILLPLVFRKFWKSIGVFIGCLFILESLQLIFKRGSFDIDDFILNTIGFLLGYLFFKLLKRSS
jgi:glycosyltransferase involved in cell wall biosynthesis